MKYYIISILLLCCGGILFANYAFAQVDLNYVKGNIVNATIDSSAVSYNLLKVRFSLLNTDSSPVQFYNSDIHLYDSKSQMYDDYVDYSDCPAFIFDINPGVSISPVVCFQVPKEQDLTYSLYFVDSLGGRLSGSLKFPLPPNIPEFNTINETNATVPINSTNQANPSVITSPNQSLAITPPNQSIQNIPQTTPSNPTPFTNNSHPLKAVGTFGTLQIDRNLYVITNVQNTTIEVDGTINQLVSGNDEVTIDFTLPDGSTKNSQITANSDGTFHTTLPLDSNSEKGSYSVSASYSNTSIGALTFTVNQISASNNPSPINSQNSPLPTPSITTATKIPSWVKNIFIFYGQGRISDDDLIGAIQYLVQQGIIHLKS